MPNMEFYEKRLPDGELMETIAVWHNAGKWSGITALSIKAYSNGFCEVCLFGRKKLHPRSLQKISRQTFQIRFVQAMQFLSAVVSSKIIEQIQTELQK